MQFPPSMHIYNLLTYYIRFLFAYYINYGPFKLTKFRIIHPYIFINWILLDYSKNMCLFSSEVTMNFNYNQILYTIKISFILFKHNNIDTLCLSTSCIIVQKNKNLHRSDDWIVFLDYLYMKYSTFEQLIFIPIFKLYVGIRRLTWEINDKIYAHNWRGHLPFTDIWCWSIFLL